ncbi:MAG: HIT domain-containing protein [Actinomycetales bacterium]|nr:HIT domain-containing protein [Actinomycetales bacterium]MBP8880912.1 HIT domain-containing protein [Dermatophilaceae bacterium]
MRILADACDESGLCEELELLSQGQGASRLVHAAADWAALVDIAPIIEGHLLICPYQHVHASLDLEETKAFWLSCHQLAQRLCHNFGYSNYMLIEHGTRPDYCGPSCVRHVHVHLTLGQPTRLAEAISTVVDKDREHSSCQAALDAVSLKPSYLILSSAPDHWIIGTPKPEIRQSSRRILVEAYCADLGLVDWAVTAAGESHIASVDKMVQLSGSADLERVGTVKAERAFSTSSLAVVGDSP